MTNNAEQNRLAIQLAEESLRRSGFENISSNDQQGTYPHTRITAKRRGKSYFIGVTSRQEIGADAEYNRSFNIVTTAADMKIALSMAKVRKEIPAFVTIALNRQEGSFAAFFGTLASVDNKRSIPMLPRDRIQYEELVPKQSDPRIVSLG